LASFLLSRGILMSATPVRPARRRNEPPSTPVPLLPTVVVGSYKGGVWKTSVAVSVAERLAWAGLRILLVTSDTQEDARSRLGLRANAPPVATTMHGQGRVTVIGIRGARAIDILYRFGPARLDSGVFDMVLVDTPPELFGGTLPGVLLITPMDGTDAVRNLVPFLRQAPSNTEILLVRVGQADLDEWAETANSLGSVLDRPLEFLEEPLRRSQRVHVAHDQGKSVWTLSRHGRAHDFLMGIDSLAEICWAKIRPNREWPEMPAAADSEPYVPGWDDDT